MPRHNRLLAYSEFDKRRGTYRVRYRNRSGERITVASGIEDTEKGRKLVKATIKSEQRKLDNNLIGHADSNVDANATFERWLRDRDDFTPQTVTTMKNSLVSLLRRVSIMSDFTPSADDRPGTIETWRDDMRAGKGFLSPLKRSTIYRRMNDAKNWLRWCKDKGIVELDLFKGVKNPQPKSTATFLSDDEIEGVEKACEGARYRPFLAMFRLGWTCGMREGEMFAARAENLRYLPDGSGQLLLTGTKSVGSTKSRVIPIPQETMLLMGSKRQGPLVPSLKYPSRGWRAPGLQFWWKEVKKAAGITRKLPFHSTRHTFAKRYLEKGGQEGDLAEFLGHESTEMIHEVYGHWSTSTLTSRAKNVISGIVLAGHRRDNLTIIGVTDRNILAQSETDIEGMENEVAS